MLQLNVSTFYFKSVLALATVAILGKYHYFSTIQRPFILSKLKVINSAPNFRTFANFNERQVNYFLNLDALYSTVWTIHVIYNFLTVEQRLNQIFFFYTIDSLNTVGISVILIIFVYIKCKILYRLY